MKERLDTLVQRRAGVTRARAQGLIRAGKVFGVDGQRLDKPGMQVDADVALDIREGPRYVSRGGEKLAAALDVFQLDVGGRVCIDVGASTGGFTDCLLQRGAVKVYAVDVGYGQLAWKLRQDPRVVVMERTNIRDLTPDSLPDPPDFFTIDCAFISLRLVLPALRPLLAPGASGVALIKPQFEAGRKHVGKGGVVRDEQARDRAVSDVLAVAVEIGFEGGAIVRSPLAGPAGNIEFLARLRLVGPGVS